MPFIPNASLKEEMLRELKIKDIKELFSDIPEEIKVKDLNIPEGRSQLEVERELKKIAEKNKPFPEMLSFLGGGIKPHYVPATVKAIVSRSEFYTSYTPYQPELSQGLLQAMFEYQSLIAELTGMEIANSSLYDASTALGEAVRMSYRIRKGKEVLIPNNISWERKLVLRNYVKGLGVKIKEIRYDDENGTIDINHLEENLSRDAFAVYVENPNYFGIFEEMAPEISDMVHKKGAVFIVGVDPISLGIVKPPGEYGADIVVGEGRCLGMGMNFGGSSLGIFACRKKFLRQLPGRIIGLTHDRDGNRAFCMTLQTREQHIRREKATSNICTNEALCALSAAVYLSLIGSKGLVELAKLNLKLGRLLAERICSLPWFKKRFKGKHFNEFVASFSHDADYLNAELAKRNMQAGLHLGRFYPELKNCLLFGITELYTEKDIDRLLIAIKEVYHV